MITIINTTHPHPGTDQLRTILHKPPNCHRTGPLAWAQKRRTKKHTHTHTPRRERVKLTHSSFRLSEKQATLAETNWEMWNLISVCDRGNKLQWISDSQLCKDASWPHQLETKHAASHLQSADSCLSRKMSLHSSSPKKTSKSPLDQRGSRNNTQPDGVSSPERKHQLTPQTRGFLNFW